MGKVLAGNTQSDMEENEGFSIFKVGEWINAKSAPLRARIFETFGVPLDDLKGSSSAAIRSAVNYADKGDIMGAMGALNKADLSNCDATESGLVFFNKACLYCRLNRFEEAAENLITAVVKYDSPYKYIFTDNDIKLLRDERPDLMTKVRKAFAKKQRETQGYEESADESATERGVRLRMELENPYRGLWAAIFAVAIASAGLGTFVSVLKLAKGAPVTIPENFPADKEPPKTRGELFRNLGINTAVILGAGLGLNRNWDFSEKSKKNAQLSETLNQLSVRVGDGSVQSVSDFYSGGDFRPVIIAGTKKALGAALRQAKKRNLVKKMNDRQFVPIIFDWDDFEQTKAVEKKETRGFGITGNEEQENKMSASDLAIEDQSLGKGLPKDQIFWPESLEKANLRAVNPQNWVNVFESLNLVDMGAKVEVQNGVFICIGRNGQIVAKGPGTPPFEQLIDNFPDKDSFQN